MDRERRPRSREKRVSQEGKGVEKYGEGLHTGPANNTGSYEDRRQQEAGQSGAPRQARNPFVQSRPQGSGTQRPAQNPFAQQSRPQGSGTQRPAQNPFAQSRPQGSGTQRPTQSPYTQSRPQQTGSGRQMNGSGQSGTGGTRQGGGGGKLLLIIIAIAVLLGGGKLSGLLGGGDSGLDSLMGGPGGYTGTQETGTSTGGFGGYTGTQGTGSGAGTALDFGTESQGSQLNPSDLLSGGSSSGLTDLLSAFLGSGSSSVYDFTGDPSALLTGGLTGGSTSAGSGASSGFTGAGASEPDLTVSGKAREKYTTIRGGRKDQITLLVYLCGTDLESQNGMGTSDLKEMAAATLGKNINLLVYTGGCRRWRNSVVSSSVNQIYQIQDGKLYCLEKDMGSDSMISPATLTRFIKYGAENFPANRMCLILWDHGGGSVTGYGYDEKYGSGRSMSLAGIQTALKNAGQKFDFIGFDACLMATVENGLMLGQFADYMIASEETEPGVGWYYTNWLTQLGKNPSMPTAEIGKMIADDFVAVCAQKCRGQGTTLSVVDLAELQATVPSALKAFGTGTNQLIQDQEYRTVATARSKTREFAQSTRIDQIDLVHFANNLGTDEGKKLAKALQGAVKYNRTGGSVNNAYGLSIYFPYKRTGKVTQAVSAYQAIGMDEEYTRCIQEFASLETSGQIAAGTPVSGYSSQSIGMSSLMNSLLGTGSYPTGISSSPDEVSGMLGSLFGGSAGGAEDLFGFFSGRSLTAESAGAYLSAHHLDPSLLVWNGNRMTLSGEQWQEVESLVRNVFVDDGEGYIDLGTDSEFTLEGNDLVDDFDGTWLSVNGQPIAYYYLGTEDDGENYAITGYSPALLNGARVNLMLVFDNEHPYGTIAGAQPVYLKGETEAQAKNLIQIGKGDEVQFLCEYYDYEGGYQDMYYLGKPMTLTGEDEIYNTPIGDRPVRETFCFTDFYQQRYWTPARYYGA